MSAVILEATGITTNEIDEEDIATKADATYGPLLKTKWGQTRIGGVRVFNTP